MMTLRTAGDSFRHKGIRSLRRVPIRMKLAAALAVPLFALAAVTFFEVARTSGAVRDIREQTALAKAAIGPAGLITTLQNERTWMSVEIVGWGDLAARPVRGYGETPAAPRRRHRHLPRRDRGGGRRGGADLRVRPGGPGLAGPDPGRHRRLQRAAAG